MIGDCWLAMAMAMGDGKWNGYEWWFHGQHTDASFNSLSRYVSLASDCLNCCCCCCCCIVFAMRFALLIRRFRSLYIFVHSSSGISVVCVEISPEWFLYIHSAVKLQIRTEDGRKTTYIFVLACTRWPISDVANDLHPSERGAHCTILQQQVDICTYIHTVHMYSNLGRPLCHLPFHCTIAQCLLQLYFISWFFFIYTFLGWFCIALLTLKTK